MRMPGIEIGHILVPRGRDPSGQHQGSRLPSSSPGLPGLFKCHVTIFPLTKWIGGSGDEDARLLARADFLSMRRVLALHFQPIRFAKFHKDSVDRGLPVLKPARGLDPWC